MYKSLADVERVVKLGKPQSVIDRFVESYLQGVALQPYFDAEARYDELLSQPDVPDVPAVYEDDVLVTPEYSANTERDLEITDLLAQYPYLEEPIQTYTPEVVYVDGEAVVEDRPDYMPTRAERRGDIPSADIDMSSVLRTYKKVLRADAIKNATITTSTGKVFNADEKSQERMARAIMVGQLTGQTETNWTLADNTNPVVTTEEMVEALALSMNRQSELWFI